MLHVLTNGLCPVQHFCREVVIWRSLHHPNVLRLLGATVSENQFTMISEWTGNINEFVKAHPDVNRLEFVCFLFKVLILACHRLTHDCCSLETRSEGWFTCMARE